MFGSSVLTLVVVLWGVATVGFIAVMIWKSFVGRREEDIVILDPAEALQFAEQQVIISKVERLTLWAKCFGFTSLGLLVVAGGIVAYKAVLTFTHPQIP
jgi:hypothetical protein